MSQDVLYSGGMKTDARLLGHKMWRELRKRAVASVQTGEMPTAVARILGIHDRTIFLLFSVACEIPKRRMAESWCQEARGASSKAWWQGTEVGLQHRNDEEPIAIEVSFCTMDLYDDPGIDL